MPSQHRLNGSRLLVSSPSCTARRPKRSLFALAAAPGGPKAITRLPEHVVNRIAAGEIIQRPANALKELIENALDAGSTRISITVKEGGLKQLIIQDNGSGIRKDDLPILCERFTTSKIRAFEDLSSLGTYGFRGEALASISHVAHLSVTTKTKQDGHAWKAAYADGKLVPVNSASKNSDPVPSAGNDGTTLTVEDLFYNTPQRLKSLRSSSEEYARIVSVVLAYSIHNAGVAMSCRKNASTTATADVSTSTGASVLDNIGLHYGEAVKRELVEVTAEGEEPKVKIRAWCSGANYQGKKATFLFFVNNRQVDCSPLKGMLQSFYANLLAKGTYPFVYLALDVDPTKIDVNVHPTKKEVGLEDEDEIVALLSEKLAAALEKQGESRSYKVQTLLPSAGIPKPTRTQSGSSSNSGTPTASASTARKPAKPKIAPNKLVRTDAQSQTLDALFPSLGSSSKSKSRSNSSRRSAASIYIDDEAGVAGDDYDDEDDELEEEEDEANERGASSSSRPAKKKSKRQHQHQSDHDPTFARQLAAEQALQARTARVRIAQSECALTSVRQLRKKVVEERHEGLDQIVKNHIFVGVADLESCWTMLQHQTKLYLVNHAAFAETLFYQLGLRQFGRFSRIKLNPPPPLRRLVKLAVSLAEHQEGREKSKLSGDEIVERVYNTLMDARAMLEEYFAFSITDDGKIESLPLVLPGYSPDLSKLPLFLLRIGAHVDWENEKECFDSFLHELAYFYSPTPGPTSPSPAPPPSSFIAEPSAEEEARRAKEEERKKTLQHVVFPAIKQYLVPPERLLKRDVVLTTSLESLYRVFERC
ncbi:hypothetical protein JCM8097_008910 [Rhodosporidiobolus ruineniae]